MTCLDPDVFVQTRIEMRPRNHSLLLYLHFLSSFDFPHDILDSWTIPPRLPDLLRHPVLARLCSDHRGILRTGLGHLHWLMERRAAKSPTGRWTEELGRDPSISRGEILGRQCWNQGILASRGIIAVVFFFAIAASYLTDKAKATSACKTHDLKFFMHV